jgi:hypothetical protein
MPDLPPRPPEEDELDERANRLKQVQRSLVVQNSVPLQDEEGEEFEAVNRPGEFYKRYRIVQELPDNARAFYELAGGILPR